MTKNIFKFANVILLSVIISSCSDTNKNSNAAVTNNGGGVAINSDGSCSQETTYTYNDISAKIQMYVATNDTGYLIGASVSCNKLKTMLGVASCSALNAQTNQPMVISYGLVESTCTTLAKF